MVVFLIFSVPRSRVIVLLVVTSTVAAFVVMVAVAVGDNVGVPKVQPVGGVGVVSVTVHTVPVGMSLTVFDPPAPRDVAGVGRAAVVVDGEGPGEASGRP